MDFCLKDYVGVKLCDDSLNPPGSGLYINSLPGLSIEALDNIADSEQITYKGIYSDAQDEAWQLFQVDFFNALSNCYDIKSTDDWSSLICPNKKKLVGAWRYLIGVELMIYRQYSPRLNFFTMDAKEAAGLQTLYQTEYESALEKSMKIIDISSLHIHCGPGQIQSVIWLP